MILKLQFAPMFCKWTILITDIVDALNLDSVYVYYVYRFILISYGAIRLLTVFILETHYASGRTWARIYCSSDYASGRTMFGSSSELTHYRR